MNWENESSELFVVVQALLLLVIVSCKPSPLSLFYPPKEFERGL